MAFVMRWPAVPSRGAFMLRITEPGLFPIDLRFVLARVCLVCSAAMASSFWSLSALSRFACANRHT